MYLLFWAFMPTLGVAKFIDKKKLLAKALATIGVYSFDIMALHFISFKLVLGIYIVLSPHASRTDLAGFPSPFAESLWLPYLIIGVSLPILIRAVFNQTMTRLKANKRRQQH